MMLFAGGDKSSKLACAWGVFTRPLYQLHLSFDDKHGAQGEALTKEGIGPDELCCLLRSILLMILALNGYASMLPPTQVKAYATGTASWVVTDLVAGKEKKRNGGEDGRERTATVITMDDLAYWYLERGHDIAPW